MDHRQETQEKRGKMERSRSREQREKKKKKKHYYERERSHSESQHRRKKKNYYRERSRSSTKREEERKRKRKYSRQRQRERENQDREKRKHKKKRSYSNSRSRSRDKNYYKKKEKVYERRPNQRFQKNQNYRREQSFHYGSKFKFDSPPKSDESVMSDDSQKMQKLSQMKAAKQLVTSKADRKLYLGNLPPNITSNQLMEMLNSALKKMEINTDVEGDSIVSAWISPDGVGHYAFVEFRTSQEATNGLTLNGASLFGYQLKLGRPKQYIEYNKQLLSQIGTDKNLETILKKVETLGRQDLPPVEEKIVTPPSKIIILKHIVSIEELGIDEQYNEILQDVKDMAKRFGTIVNIIIPRPHEMINLELAPTRIKGLGLIFIEYGTVSQAMYARRELVKKEFSGRPVACSYFEEERFREGDYDIMDKVIIEF